MSECIVLNNYIVGYESVRNLFEFVLHKLQSERNFLSSFIFLSSAVNLIQTRIVVPILSSSLENKDEKNSKMAKQLKQEQLRKTMSDLSWSLDRSDFSDISFVFVKENKK